jgi:hypothetical protein
LEARGAADRAQAGGSAPWPGAPDAMEIPAEVFDARPGQEEEREEGLRASDVVPGRVAVNRSFETH